jgi:hypothetical protein
MSEKILQVVQKITGDMANTTDIVKHKEEYFFKYKDYTISIMKRSSMPRGYTFFIYPRWNKAIALLNLVEKFKLNATSEIYIDAHRSEDYVGAFNAFAALYDAIDRKYSNIDSVIDGILS